MVRPLRRLVDPGPENPLFQGSIDVSATFPMTFDFLQGDDIGAVDLAGDSFQIEPAVLAEPELDVVGDDFHRIRSLIPKVLWLQENAKDS
jgi:hypothetical protein